MSTAALRPGMQCSPRAALAASLVVLVLLLGSASLASASVTTRWGGGLSSPVRAASPASAPGPVSPAARPPLGQATTAPPSALRAPVPAARVRAPTARTLLPAAPPIPVGLSSGYSGHYWAGLEYDGTPENVTSISVVLTVPADAPPRTELYAVALSLWDTSASYDQIGFGSDEVGQWALADSTSSPCAGTYFGGPYLVLLDPGATYLFEMGLSNGVLRFTVDQDLSGSLEPFFATTHFTGGSAFVAAPTYSCLAPGGGQVSDTYADLTDYEEVWSTTGPVVPYSFQFENNTGSMGSLVGWVPLSVSPASVQLSSDGSSTTIANEPYDLRQVPGGQVGPIALSGNPRTVQVNVSVGALGPDGPVDLSVDRHPADWTVSLTPSSGLAPFAATLSIGLPGGAGAGSYVLVVNASDGSGSFTRLTVEVDIAVYPVSFRECGVPWGTNWSLSVNGTAISSAAEQISTLLPNGTYPYVLGPVAGFAPTPSRGSIDLAGAGVAEAVTFQPASPFAVNFTEYGLPAYGLKVPPVWSVDLGGRTANGSAANGFSITFTAENGTYGFAVSTATGFAASPASGSVVVQGSTVDVWLNFTRAPTYAITFRERGLAMGATWGITLSGTTENSSSDVVTFSVAQGLYPLAARPPPGYGLSRILGPDEPAVDQVSIGGAVEFRLHFTPLEPLFFNETVPGRTLPPGTFWSVQILPAARSGGPLPRSAGTTNRSIQFTVPGKTTYRFVVTYVPANYRAKPSHGSITVGVAHPKTKIIRFIALAQSNPTYGPARAVPGSWRPAVARSAIVLPDDSCLAAVSLRSR